MSITNDTLCTLCNRRKGNHYFGKAGTSAGNVLFCPKQNSNGTYSRNTEGKMFSTEVQMEKKLSRECPCGIFRADCSYHKA